MKRIVTICLVLMSIAAASAQSTGRHRLSISDIELTKHGSFVDIAFTATAGKRVTSGGSKLQVRPVLQHGSQMMELPSFTIRGWRMNALEKRYEMTAGRRAPRSSEPTMTTGSSMKYSVRVEYEPWMTAGELVFRGTTIGAGRTVVTNLGLVAENIIDTDLSHRVVITEELDRPMMRVVSHSGKSVGQLMEEHYGFISSVHSLGGTANEVLRPTPATYEEWYAQSDKSTMSLNPQGEVIKEVFGMDRSGAVPIYFPVGSSVLDQNYMDNNESLVALVAAVRALDNANGARIVAMVIAGFASPEGKINANDRLAWDRAMAVRKFLLSNSNVDPSVLRVYNGRADWIGLRSAVQQSDIPAKRRILDIIDKTPIWDAAKQKGRLGELMRISGGTPYKYMESKIFPELRSAAYIRLFYEEN